MFELKKRAVQVIAGDEIFQAIARGAIKARAGRLAPGSLMEVGEYTLTVVEDENGEGSSVQIIQSQERMEKMALAEALSLDRRSENWSDHERRVWLAELWKDLAVYLEKWQKIKMRPGPGENITFETQVSR